MRTAAAPLAAIVLACAGPRAPASAPARPDDGTVLRGAELARVRCLLVAPLENASDVPLAADAATGALLSGVDPDRARVFPVRELRALFRETPLELPEGVSPSLALELAYLLGADAALYGAVEGRARATEAGAEGGLLVTIRLALASRRDLLFAATAPVTVGRGERPEDAVRRTALEAAGPVLARLGEAGPARCFDPERTRALRSFALADHRFPPASSPLTPPRTAAPPAAVAAPAPGPAATGAAASPPAAPAAPPAPALVEPRTPRQAEWARQLASGERFAPEDVVFAGRSADLQRDAGLADLAVALAAAPGAEVRVEAFVDATSDPEADARLTAAMAQAIVQRLSELGVARARLSWAGRGGESPLLPNFTARGRAANRRIEIVGRD